MNSKACAALKDRRRWEFLPEFATAQLPRYTSYPPATRFTDAVGERASAAALAVLPNTARLSLYIHIPFCQKLCWYCGCHTSVPTRADPLEPYLDALKREIELVAARIAPLARVVRVHLGGGSPDILTPDQMKTLFVHLRSHFNFSGFTEIDTELDPRGITPALVDSLAEQGLSRASLGVQVLDAGVQQRINRIQPAADISRAIRWLREAGVNSINTDLMYGLPGQTVEHVIDAATFTATHDIDRIAVFGYAHVPWMKKHQGSIRTADLPSAEQRFRQAEAASLTLEQAGYLPIGFDHFAAPGDSLAAASMQGRLHRNFQGYTDDDATALIGLGASAISSLPNLICQNAPDTTAYRDLLGRDQLPVVRGVPIVEQDAKVANVIERLLCDFEAVVPSEILASATERLGPVLDAGLAELREWRITVTARGMPYVRNVAACFDPQFAPQPSQHSLAI
ncbi:MAG: oxygen-independent coproporphyrinogen III oxidase [Hyphomonadaceae bacterium]